MIDPIDCIIIDGIPTAGSGYDAGYALSDDGGNGSSGYSHLRESEKSEDHNRVKDDIGDSTA